MLPKPKTPFKIHFFYKKKNLIINIFYFSEGVMSLHLSKFGFGGEILIFAELKGAK